VYGQYQKRFEEIAKSHPNIVWIEGFDHDEIEKYINNPEERCLLICDDLMDVVNKDKRFTAFYIKRSHHLRVSIILTVQNLYMEGLRTVNLNTTGYVLFKSLRDMTQIRTLAMQMYASKWKKMIDIYTDATR
jgi:hypothetical protein